MNIHKAITHGQHSKVQIMKLVDYVGDSPDRFKVLVEVFLEGPYRVTQRAAWPMTYCVERNPSLIQAHLRTILAHLKKKDIHDAVKRNTIRLLQFIEIPKRFQGPVAAICFDYLHNKKEAVAIRVFSMTVLGHIAKQNPGLKQELRMLIEDQLPYASAAFKSRGRKILSRLQ